MSARHRLGILLLLMSPATAISSPQAQRSPEILRALIFSGQNNHDWRQTTPRIRAVLAGSGLFEVEITEHPESCDSETLRPYDLIVSNWNAFASGSNKPGVSSWPASAREAFITFLRRGGGLLTIHAGSSSFYHWPEYAQATIARWRPGRTSHGAPHAFEVRIERADHPLTRGMRSFWIHDELWRDAAVQPGARVLARAWSDPQRGGSGRWEPVVLVRSYGEGRSCALLLGHDLRAMRHPAWAALVVRGAQWVARGRTSSKLPLFWPANEFALAALECTAAEAVEAVREYRFGADRRPLRVLAQKVWSTVDDAPARSALAAQMGALLGGAASLACKRFLCRQLALIGSAEQEAALRALLAEPALAADARGALECIAAARATPVPARPPEVPPRAGAERELAGLRTQLAGADAAARRAALEELGRWPDADPIEDLLAVAEGEAPRAEKLLALRGILSLRERAGDRLAVDLEALLRRAIAAARASDLLEESGFLDLFWELERPVNLALGARADSPDGLEPDYQGREAPAAIDGDPGTYWDEQDDRELYRLRLVLAEPHAIAALRISGFAQHSYAPRDFSVLIDGEEVRRVSGATYRDNHLLVPLEVRTGRAVVLEIRGCYGRSPAIRELEVYGPPGSGGGAQLEWRDGDISLALVRGGRIVWNFHYGVKAAKPFFHPVALAGGPVLTWNAPPDHPWHHGLWFSWKYIDGVNYWEEERSSGRSAGTTEVRAVRTAARDDHSARIELKLRYLAPSGESVLDERRVIEISAPDASGGYHMDWEQRFQAGDAPVLLDRTPLPGEPGGKSWGGYAGLSVRFARGFGEWQALSSAGARGLEAHGKRATAMDFSGRIGEVRAGIAILDHPANPGHPSPWFAIMDPAVPFAYFSPALLYAGPRTLAAGAATTLRYRVIIHRGAFDRAALRAAFEDYIH